jgi:hypothetical protein
MAQQPENQKTKEKAGNIITIVFPSKFDKHENVRVQIAGRLTVVRERYGARCVAEDCCC